MAVIKTLVKQAYASIGSIDDGEEVSGTEGSLAVLMLNQIIAQANSDQIFPPEQAIITHTLNGSPSYTIGENGDIDAPRPEYIDRIIYYSNASDPQDLWRLDLPDLIARTDGSTGDPEYWAYAQGYPLGTIYFDTLSAGTIKVIYAKEIPPITSLNDNLTTLPPKYDSYLVAALARALAVHKRRPTEVIANLDSLYYQAKDFIINSNGRQQVPTLSDFAGRRGSVNGSRFLRGR